MKKMGLYFKLLYYLYRLSKNPENTPMVLKISPILVKLGFVNGALKAIAPYESTLNESNYFLKPIDLNKLKDMPKGTLGFTYAQHVLTNNLDPDFYGGMVDVGQASRYLFRIRQTHDLWHVLSGFSTSIEDELGLQAFIYAQVRSPLAPILIGAAFLKAGLNNNPNISILFNRILDGWKSGQDARGIYGLDWDANWLTPIEDLRRQHNVSAVIPSFLYYQKLKADTASPSFQAAQ